MGHGPISVAPALECVCTDEAMVPQRGQVASPGRVAEPGLRVRALSPSTAYPTEQSACVEGDLEDGGQEPWA